MGLVFIKVDKKKVIVLNEVVSIRRCGVSAGSKSIMDRQIGFFSICNDRFPIFDEIVS